MSYKIVWCCWRLGMLFGAPVLFTPSALAHGIRMILRLDRMSLCARQRSLRRTLSIAESSAASLNGFLSTVALTRRKKNSIAGLF